jgi:alanine-alpha-ketoisovalerate/valine-pyruvate aminotransferase
LVGSGKKASSIFFFSLSIVTCYFVVVFAGLMEEKSVQEDCTNYAYPQGMFVLLLSIQVSVVSR